MRHTCNPSVVSIRDVGSLAVTVDGPGPWRSRQALALALLCLTLIWNVGCGHSSGAATNLLVDSDIRDFGERRPGETLSHTFVLTNPTSWPVKIVQAVSSCSCTVIDQEGYSPGTTISPHGNLEIPVSLRTQARQDLVSGRVTINYRILSDREESAAEQSIVLRVSASMLPDFRVTPLTLDLGNVDALSAASTTRTIDVTPVANRQVTVQQVRAASDFLSVRLLPSRQSDATQPIEVALDTSRFVNSRRFDGNVIISTNSEQRPTVVVRVHGEYVAPATAVPDAIIIASDEPGEIHRDLVVSTSQPSLIQSVMAPSNDIRAQFNSGATATMEHHITISVASPDKDVNAQIRINLELFPDGADSVVRTLSVPVHRFSRNRGVKNGN